MMLVARFMSSKELRAYRTGKVLPSDFGDNRVWDEDNHGERGYYTFMACDTEREIKLNITSIIPWLADRYKEEKGMLCFFSTKNLSTYEGGYRGIVQCDEYDSGHFGRDCSVESSVEHYSKDDFRLIACYAVTGSQLPKVFFDGLKRLKKIQGISRKDFVGQARSLQDKLHWYWC